VNTEISEIESETPETPPEEIEIEETKPEKDPPRRGGSAFSFFALIFSLAALAGAGWMWWQDQASTGQEEQRMFAEITRLESSDSELSLKLSQIRDELNSLAAGDVGAEFETMQRHLEADRSKLDQVEQAISEQLALSRSLQAAADSMHGRLAAAEAVVTGMSTRELDAGGELDIAEVDYLLRLANERLKLFFDPAAADQALEVADMHLAALDNPMYLGVRQDIAAARRDLASVNMPDYMEITSQLDSLQQEIASLPLRGAAPATTASEQAAGDGWWEKVKGVFSNLVTVRRSTDEENQRISLQDKDYIRQRVWLQLEFAHLSLMRRDQEAFRTSLKRVQETLSTWFDPSDSKYQTVEKGINGLMAIEVQVDVPDITAPWSTLRLLRANQTRSAPALAPAPQQQAPEGEPEVEAEGG
jgi:uroporphyrin-3 C-methyltransferase